MATYDPRGGGELAVSEAGAVAGTRPQLNLIEGGGIDIALADDPGNNRVNATLTVTGSGGPPSGAAGGDLAGTYPNPTVGANKVTGAKFRQSAARSLVANATNALADVADLAGGGAGTVFQDTGTALVAQALTRILQNLSLEGDVTPAQLAANTDNWNPKATASVVRFSTDANGREIRGLVPSTNDGDVCVLINVGSNTGIVKQEQGTSTATNRFKTADVTIGADEAALLYHDPNEDGGVGRWRVILKLLTLGTAAHQVCAGTDARLSDQRTPTDASVTPAKFAASAIDPAAGTAGARTLGTGAAQACAGNDSRLSDTRTPTDNSVTTAKLVDDNVTLAKLVEIAALTVLVNATNATANPTALAFSADGQVLRRNGTALEAALLTDANVATANKDGASGTASMRTLGTGSAQACAGNDSRLSDTRTPTDATVSMAKFTSAVALALQQYKKSVRVKTTGALAANTASGTGVGKTLTANANGALTVDGVTVATSDRVLVAHESTGANNGVYTVTATGSAGAAWVLTRATDFDEAAEVTCGLELQVEEGTVYGSTTWRLTTANTITVDTTALAFRKVGGRVSVVSLTDAATIAVDASLFSVNGTDVGRVTLGGNRTVGNWTNATDGQRIEFQWKQDGTGSRTLAGDTKYRAGSDVAFPTLTTTTGKMDRHLVQYHSTDDKFDTVAVTKGF